MDGVVEFVTSATSQYLREGKVDWGKTAGSALNKALIGGTKAVLLDSGVSKGLAFAAEFVTGTVGSAIEQGMSTGRVSWRKSLKAGLINATVGRIYGDQPLKNLGNAFIRGGSAGAAESGINYLFDTLGKGKPRKNGRSGISPYGQTRDPRSGCYNGLGNSRGDTAYGYQYNENQTGSEGGFNLYDFGKEMLSGGLQRGTSSAAFFGVGKAVEKLGNSILDARKGGSESNFI